MKNLLSFFIILFALGSQAQESNKFNLDFEVPNNQTGLGDGWIKWGTYQLALDSDAYSGKRSGKINAPASGGDFGSIAYQIPAKYAGKNIRLEGYMKIKDVRDGFAGLLLRIDGNGKSLAFDNMQSRKITGTRDWQKYSIDLKYPKEAEMIFVAGMLVGKGEAWFDSFVLSIDGKDVQDLKEVEIELSKAALDREFDEGSGFKVPALSPASVANLELLGRVWGFLKYHHPALDGQTYNWDYELFRFLPAYLTVPTKGERNNLIIKWIDSLGELKKCTNCKPTGENAFLKPDLKWLESQDDPLKEKLLHVYTNRMQGKQYHVSLAPGVANPMFTNEKPYPTMSYPDPGYRLLSLFRYWNLINYFFPYRHLMDKDWNTTLSEYIPIFLNAKDELEYELAAIQLIGDVKDTHANLWGGANEIDAWKGKNYSNLHVRFIGNKLAVTDVYNPELTDEEGLKIGDIITKINGVEVDQLVRERTKYYPASNFPTQLRDIAGDMLRSNANQLNIHLAAIGTEQPATIKLYPRDSLNIYRWYKKSTEKSYKILDNNIGYITLQTIKAEDPDKIKEEFKDTKGIIIDIRNYPSTFVPFALGSFFVDSTTPFVKFTHGNPDNPGEFKFVKELEIPSKGKTYTNRVIVLINEFTQSQAEYTAMAFRAGVNTTVIGSTTAAADGNVSSITLPGGLNTMISGIGVYYPDGRETQRVGIVPDIEVIPTIEGIRAGRDELLEKAIELILAK